MNQPTAALGALNIMKAMRNRWRTIPASASMSIGSVENNFISPVSRAKRSLSEGIPDGGDTDFDPNSSEPRFLQMAKAELMRRRDLTCGDCGYVGLPASVDGNCPDCGGLMNTADNVPQSATQTAEQIRTAIRNQAAKGRTSTRESAPLSDRSSEDHLSSLIEYHGFTPSGDHYVRDGDTLHVNTSGQWIHRHEKVQHEGHGHKSLGAHLSQYHRS